MRRSNRSEALIMADNTASLVVALSAQLTKFEKDMKAAGVMADNAVSDIEDKFSKMNPKISTSFFGNFFADLASQALKSAIDGIKDLIGRFEELQKVSEYTDTSMQWVYGLQEAFKKAGAPAGDLNTAIKSVAEALNEMQRGGDNALKTLLNAPGNQSFLKGFNRDAATAEDAMSRVLRIIAEMPSMIDAVNVGKNLGVPATIATAAWKEGADALMTTAAATAAAAPDLEKMANSAKLFDTYIRNAADAIKAWAADSAWEMIKTDISDIVKFLQLFQKGGVFTGAGLEDFGAGALKNLTELQTRMNQFGPPAPPATRVKVTGGTAEDPFMHKNTGETAQAYERETNAINKQIAAMQAENATLGESAYAQEEYRVQLILSEKAAQDGKEWTQQLNDEIAVTATRAATAKQALAEHTFAMQRLNSASQTVGSALSTAFADAIVEGKSLNDVVGSLIKTLEKAAINATINSLFSPGAGGATAPILKALGIGGNAGGTDNWGGGLTMVGERGPELVNLPRGAQVIPNDVLRSSGGGSISAPVVFNVDNRGASLEAVARMGQMMAEMQATLPGKIITTIQTARRGRVPGL
jgi:hypothetical protein